MPHNKPAKCIHQAATAAAILYIIYIYRSSLLHTHTKYMYTIWYYNLNGAVKLCCALSNLECRASDSENQPIPQPFILPGRGILFLCMSFLPSSFHRMACLRLCATSRNTQTDGRDGGEGQRIERWRVAAMTSNRLECAVNYLMLSSLSITLS